MLSWLGNALIGVSLAGIAWLALGMPEPSLLTGGTAPPPAAVVQQAGYVPGARIAGPASVSAGRDAQSSRPGEADNAATSGSTARVLDRDGGVAAPAPVHQARLPITQIQIPSIGLDAPVVPARFVQKDGATTWEIPADVAGHADLTAGPSDIGNAVLLGHVNSVRSGDVFKNLDQVAVGDEITVYAGERTFLYRVTETKSVDRTDTSMLRTTDTPVLTIFTCTGVWLPHIWDYTERLVVRAEQIEKTP